MSGNNKMLIDATHPEQTRVAVVKGNRVEEFDFESQDKQQIRGNIYLAKVTRVEPSLQAAFVEYGGNRHGFLAFSEIHPDYYQIPLADREALLQEEQEEQRAEAAEDDAVADAPAAKRPRRRRRSSKAQAEAVATESVSEEVSEDAEAKATETDGEKSEEVVSDDDAKVDADAANTPTEATADDADEAKGDEASDVEATDDADADDESDDGSNGDEDEANGEDGDVDQVGQEDAMEEVPVRRKRQRKQYKIQEVIKRRQILLVQVVKEERGNKGAALTTYLSLAGRYCVLMPNTPRGGGISRKITNAGDRKRLKSIAGDLAVPQGMGVIVRTAGASRTKMEINRDFEYLSRLWENVRSLTLESSAPCLVYEEGSLIKRSIRDLYNKDIGEVWVAGEQGFREAKEFMRMLMPSHAKSVMPYRDPTPLFAKYGIEAQLDGMMKPEVTLKSGGYIVINQTEALVAIDVNSGRSTREHSIEDTAHNTNLEAAEEIARQLRLRDLAGLIVIDFIDMEERRNNRSVEKKLKDCLKNDRARIQVGRISHFGLMEMSRQRLRASVLDSTTNVCSHCSGTGLLRSEATLALQILRGVEEAMLRGGRNDVVARAHTDVALFLLNHKRDSLSELEQRYGKLVSVVADPTVSAQDFTIEKGELSEVRTRPQANPTVQPDSVRLSDQEDARIDAELAAKAKEAEQDDPEELASSNSENGEQGDGEGNPKRRKRRRRRRGGSNSNGDADANADVSADSEDNGEKSEVVDAVDGQSRNGEAKDGDEEESSNGRRRRRGRRGGKRNRKDAEETAAAEGETAPADAGTASTEEPVAAEAASEEKPKRRSTRRKKAEPKADAAAEVPAETVSEAAPVEEDAPKPKRKRRTKKQIEEDKAAEEAKKAEAANAPESPAETETAAEEKPKRRSTRRKPAEKKETSPEEVSVSANGADAPQEPSDEGDKKPRKGGWWQRRGGFF